MASTEETSASASAASAPAAATGGSSVEEASSVSGRKRPRAQERTDERAGAAADDDAPKRPQKRHFRQRAHCNPLAAGSFDYPTRPEDMDWAALYPERAAGPNPQQVKFLDVGCGFGGLLIGLSPLFSDKLILGLEIRKKVEDYVHKRIKHLRASQPGLYQNVSVLRTNAMRYLSHFIRKGQLEKMFFCFPDPHFKAKKHRWRIISPALLAEYAYLLQPGGRLYTVTDVPDLHSWMRDHCQNHPFFRPVPQQELDQDTAVKCVLESTEEGKKVARGGGSKYLAVFERVPDGEALGVSALDW